MFLLDLNRTSAGFEIKMSLKACIGDRISGLPDEILCHILSFLVTEEAVKASVLSRRWKNVWAYNPNIDLCDLRCGRRIHSENFEGIVNLVLLSRGSLDIHRFSLSCEDFVNYSCFDAWIRSAVRHNVVELVLILLMGVSAKNWILLMGRPCPITRVLSCQKACTCATHWWC